MTQPGVGVRRIPAGRFAAGVMIHVFPFVFLVAVVAKIIHDGGLLTSRSAISEDLALTRGLFACWVALTALVAVLSACGSALARAHERRRTARSMRDPAGRSRIETMRAQALLPSLAAAFGPEAEDASTRILAGMPRWDHENPVFQKLARDLAEAIVVLSEASAEEGDPEGRIAPLARLSLTTLADAADEALHGRILDKEARAYELTQYLRSSYAADPGALDVR